MRGVRGPLGLLFLVAGGLVHLGLGDLGDDHLEVIGEGLAFLVGLGAEEAVEAEEGALGELLDGELAFHLGALVGEHHGVDVEDLFADVVGEADAGDVVVEGLGVSGGASGYAVVVNGFCFHGT